MLNSLPLPATANIITLNEASNIKSCIEALQPFFAEIIVVDSNSTDATCAIAKDLGAKIITQTFLGDGPQKAVVEKIAKYDWIFSIDADERPDAGFADFCKQVDLANLKPAYSFSRKNFVGTHRIKVAGFYPDFVIRFYNRQFSGYCKNEAHGKVISPKVVKTKAYLSHQPYANYKDWFSRTIYQAQMGANELHKKGIKANRTAPITHSIAAFIKKYLLQGGIFRGLDGFTVAITTAFTSYAKYSLLFDLEANKQNKPKKQN